MPPCWAIIGLLPVAWSTGCAAGPRFETSVASNSRVLAFRNEAAGLMEPLQDKPRSAIGQSIRGTPSAAPVNPPATPAPQPTRSAIGKVAPPSSSPVVTTVSAARGYTAPGAPYRAMTFLAIAAASVETKETLGAGREVSQSAMSASVVSRPELQGSVQPLSFKPAGNQSFISQPAGRPGLLQSAPLGGGLTMNLFNPRPNPLGARCTELVNAGFFNNAAACRDHFRR